MVGRGLLTLYLWLVLAVVMLYLRLEHGLSIDNHNPIVVIVCALMVRRPDRTKQLHAFFSSDRCGMQVISLLWACGGRKKASQPDLLQRFVEETDEL